MSIGKDGWIDEWNALYDEAIERGLSEKNAEAFADAGADHAHREKVADMIDHARLLRKEGRL